MVTQTSKISFFGGELTFDHCLKVEETGFSNPKTEVTCFDGTKSRVNVEIFRTRWFCPGLGTVKEEAVEEIKEMIPPEEEAMMVKLRNIQFGTWFEIASGPKGEPQKVILSWLSPLTSSCMFVDRAGVQTAIKSLQTLAQELISGEAKILEDSNDPFVERTLHAIRRMLQRSLQATDDFADDILNGQHPEKKSR